jgi:hypothetical protein
LKFDVLQVVDPLPDLMIRQAWLSIVEVTSLNLAIGVKHLDAREAPKRPFRGKPSYKSIVRWYCHAAATTVDEVAGFRQQSNDRQKRRGFGG